MAKVSPVSQPVTTVANSATPTTPAQVAPKPAKTAKAAKTAKTAAAVSQDTVDFSKVISEINKNQKSASIDGALKSAGKLLPIKTAFDEKVDNLGKFLNQFKSMTEEAGANITPPSTPTGPVPPQKTSFFGAIKKHPIVTLAVIAAAAGIGYWLYPKNKAEN